MPPPSSCNTLRTLPDQLLGDLDGTQMPLSLYFLVVYIEEIAIGSSESLGVMQKLVAQDDAGRRVSENLKVQCMFSIMLVQPKPPLNAVCYTAVNPSANCTALMLSEPRSIGKRSDRAKASSMNGA